jgi:hypothetical protein
LDRRFSQRWLWRVLFILWDVTPCSLVKSTDVSEEYSTPLLVGKPIFTQPKRDCKTFRMVSSLVKLIRKSPPKDQRSSSGKRCRTATRHIFLTENSAVYRRIVSCPSRTQFSLLAVSFMLVSCLAYSSTMKMEAICTYKISADYHQTTWHYIVDNRTPQEKTNLCILRLTSAIILIRLDRHVTKKALWHLWLRWETIARVSLLNRPTRFSKDWRRYSRCEGHKNLRRWRQPWPNISRLFWLLGNIYDDVHGRRLGGNLSSAPTPWILRK